MLLLALYTVPRCLQTRPKGAVYYLLLIYLRNLVVLILASRHAILDDKPTSLSKALSFLVRDYSPAFMWWELVMLWRQLYLVGFALLVMMGTVQQLVISFLVALVYMLLVSVATPFKDEGDNYFSQACSFALAATFLFVLVLKFGELTESVRDIAKRIGPDPDPDPRPCDPRPRPWL